MYFDIETTGFDREKDKIITIQYQEIDSYGRPLDKITILKEWEMGEETIINLIYNSLIIQNNWYFIPIGTNLIFDFTFLWAKFKKYHLEAPPLDEYLYSKPTIDIKYMLVMCNGLSFKGAGLDKMTNKKMDGRLVPEWYKNKDYNKIVEYIEDETKSFLEFFEKCMLKLPKLIKE